MEIPRPFILAETNWKIVKDTNYEVAILPWGATEAHNYHMPYATDNILADEMAARSAQIAWNNGAKIVVLPCIPFGVNTGQMEIDLCINMNPSTQYLVLADVAEVVVNAGIEKLVILNAHGGNNFKQMIRELSVTYPDLFACSVNWWQAVDANQFFAEPGDHAGELETSGIMAIDPEIVMPLDQAGSGADRKLKLDGFKEGWATTQRHWIEVTQDTGVGNPKEATAEKGEAHMKASAEKIGKFLTELARTSVNDLYE